MNTVGLVLMILVLVWCCLLSLIAAASYVFCYVVYWWYNEPNCDIPVADETEEHACRRNR